LPKIKTKQKQNHSFIAGFAYSWGPLCWLVCTEVQPLETRSAGYAISVVSNFAVTFLIGQAFLSMLCSMEYGIFFFFAGFVMIMTIFVLVLVPETKGVPMEEIQEVLFMKHRVWGPMVRDFWGEGGVRRWSEAGGGGDDSVEVGKKGAPAGGLALEAAAA